MNEQTLRGESSLPFCCLLRQAHHECLLNNATQSVGGQGVGATYFAFDPLEKNELNDRRTKGVGNKEM